MLNISLEFTGGAELLFGNKKKHLVQLEQTDPKLKVRDLLTWIKNNLLQERSDLFIQGDSVRPGILVLINDADWLLLGTTDYEIENDDNVVFISTLHGG